MSRSRRFALPSVLLALALAAPSAGSATTAPGPSFGARKVLGVGVGVSDPRSLVAADLDQDGRLDLIAGDRNADNGRVTVLRGLGAGAFGAPAAGPFSTGVAGAGVGPIAVGDLNDDGRPDVVAGLATGAVDDELVVLDGDGTGALAPAASGPVSTRSRVTGLALSDLDGDTDLDAFTTHEVGLTGSELAVLRHSGGGLSFVSSTGASATTMAEGLAAGDLDGTGSTDALVISHNAGAGSAWVAHARSLTLSTDLAIPVGPDPVAVTLVDVDGDGDLDGLVLDGSTGLLTVLRNDGTGALTASNVTVPGLVSGSGLAAGDLNGDGIADVAVTDDSANRVGVLLGDGHGGFGAPAWLAMGTGTRAPVIADLTGDGLPDLATADAGAAALSIRPNTSAPSPQATGAGTSDFGSRQTGTTGEPRTITIANTGQAALAIRSVSVTGAAADDFLLTSDGCTGATVRSGGTDGCDVHLRFAPSATGARSAKLHVVYAGGAYDVPLTGTGTDGAAAPDATPDPGAAPDQDATPDAATPDPGTAPLPPSVPLVVPTWTPSRRAGITRLSLTLDRHRLLAKAGAPVRVGYRLGREATLVLRVKQAGHTVDIVRVAARQGAATAVWDGRLGSDPAPAGTYRLAVYAVDASGHTARAAATVVVRG